MDEEQFGQLREVGGHAIAECDLCGVAFPRDALTLLTARRTSGEPVERVHACAACSRLVEADALPLDTEADAGGVLPDE